MDQKKRTEIASLGQFGLIDLLTSGFTPKNASTLKGAGDDAAVIAPGRGEAVLCTTDSFYEGVDFDLTYFPLKHLGYKAVTAGVSDILAMNALPAQITVSLGVSSKLPVEALQDLYEGIAFACKEQEIDLVGGDTRASMTGLVITVTTLGYAKKEKVVYRSGAQQNDLVCITGNLGAAYMGLQLLERRDIPRQRGGRGCSPAFHRHVASCGAFHPDFHYAKALPAKDSCGRSPYPASANCGRWGQRHCTGHSCTPVGQRGNRPFPPH